MKMKMWKYYYSTLFILLTDLFKKVLHSLKRKFKWESECENFYINVDFCIFKSLIDKENMCSKGLVPFPLEGNSH